MISEWDWKGLVAFFGYEDHIGHTGDRGSYVMSDPGSSTWDTGTAPTNLLGLQGQAIASSLFF
jgi:hypothetical protein